MKRFFLASLLLLLVGFSGLFFFKSQHPVPKAPIVFFGDSITAGVGASAGQDFPTLIGRKMSATVVNSGVSGDTTANALARIKTDVVAKKPAVVVVELSGNDFLQGVPIDQTKANFEKIMQAIEETKAKVLLVGIRTKLIGTDPYESFEQSLAEKYKAAFYPDLLNGIQTNPELMSDTLHPNAAGYEEIAKRLTPEIKKLF